MLAKVGDKRLLKLLPAPITLECFLSSPAVTRVYELPRWLIPDYGVRAPAEPAARQPHPQRHDPSLRASAFPLSSQHPTSEAATSFDRGMQGASQPGKLV